MGPSPAWTPASLIPTSRTPRLASSAHTPAQNLAPSVACTQIPSTCLTPSRSTPTAMWAPCPARASGEGGDAVVPSPRAANAAAVAGSVHRAAAQEAQTGTTETSRHPRYDGLPATCPVRGRVSSLVGPLSARGKSWAAGPHLPWSGGSSGPSIWMSRVSASAAVKASRAAPSSAISTSTASASGENACTLRRAR
jgi:hypothetical protein